MAEHSTTGEIEARGDADGKGNIDQLRQGLDELRSSVASLTARLGEGATIVTGRGLQQVRQTAGELAEEVADRASEGMATVRSRIEDQRPAATVALAFFAGVAFAGLVLGALLTVGSDSRPQQPPPRRSRPEGPARHPRRHAPRDNSG
jgi:hypothetical protein